MSREKQIDEMGFIIRENSPLTTISSKDVAKAIYNAGYRKQKYGKWKKRTFIIFDSEIVGYNCSECNTTWDTETKFCPNCGASMKGGAE